jgi:small subunit ribosomal protein S17
LKAHDEANASRVGDRVVIEETRPLSKDKRWRVRQILGRAS